MKKYRLFSMLLAVCLLFVSCGQDIPKTDDTQQTERIFDIYTPQDAAEKLLGIFSISYQSSWDIDNPNGLLNPVGSGVFKSMVEKMYYADTGKEFRHNAEGFTDINNYVEYGSKYFNIRKEDIYSALANPDRGYNPENETVFMSDGLGSVASLGVIQINWDEVGTYTLDYIVSAVESDYQFGTLSFMENEDGSLKFFGNKFTDTVYSPQHYSLGYPAIATSKDGKYELYYGTGVNLWNKWIKNVVLCEKDTGKRISLGFIDTDNISDAGFFSNGDVYTMDTTGLNVFRCEMTPQPYFTTKTNFRGGGVFGYDVDERYIYAIRRDPVKFDYIVVYSQAEEPGEFLYEKPNDFQLGTNYKVGLLDKDGNLTHSWDSGVPVIHSVNGFESVYISKTGENAIEFFVARGDEELRRVSVDITSGKTEIIKDYTAEGLQKKAELLAEKYATKLYVTLGWPWDCSEEVASIIILGPLETFYRMETGEDMPMVKLTENNYGVRKAAKVDTYAQVAAKYFGWSYQQMADFFRTSNAYHKESDTVIHGDYGWVCYPQITSVENIQDNLYEIRYNLYDLDDRLVNENTLTARLIDEEYFQFLKNEVKNVE